MVSQFYILIGTFIDNGVSTEGCKEFLKNLFMFDIDISKYNISDNDKTIVTSICNNYINANLQFTDKQVNIITNSFVDMVYSTFYYFNISNNKSCSFSERQIAKNNYVLKEYLVNTTKSYLIDDELGMKSKSDFLKFKVEFEKYTNLTSQIVRIYSQSPRNKDEIVRVIKQRATVSKELVNRYRESLDINNLDLISVIEDDVIQLLRENKINNKVKFAA